MTPLPAFPLVGWRLDPARFATTWASGEGAYLFGGRWNGRGVRAVYAAIDPATAILEVAVHKGFGALDRVPHVLTSFVLDVGERPQVVEPSDVLDRGWLHPGVPSAGQKAFGEALLRAHGAFVAPSVVSQRSWNVVFLGSAGLQSLRSQEPFVLDPRLHGSET